MVAPLAVNRLLMPHDFPATPFERSYGRVRQRAATHRDQFEHFAGAWNAVSIRYLALTTDGDEFTRLIAQSEGTDPQRRYQQERHLFGLFSNGFSAFEAYFYGMFAVGSLLRPGDFPMGTPKDQQAVSPTSTGAAYNRHFAGDPVLAAFDGVFQDTAYREFREVRNILTHRTAPGRRIFVGIGSDDDLPARWKINNIALDGQTAGVRRAEVARILSTLLEASTAFVEARIN